MKVYVYLSDIKIDMLYAQIPQRKKMRIAGELKLDLKLISATFSTQHPEESRFSKLEVVLKQLEEEGAISSLTYPETYFKGKLDMRWGPISLDDAAEEVKQKDMVLFSGETTRNRLVGLIGSMAHLIGKHGAAPVTADYTMPSFIAKIAEGMKAPSEEELEKNMYGTYYTVKGQLVENKGPTQSVEFVAMKFIADNSIILGSPLCVALLE